MRQKLGQTCRHQTIDRLEPVLNKQQGSFVLTASAYCGADKRRLVESREAKLCYTALAASLDPLQHLITDVQQHTPNIHRSCEVMPPCEKP